MAISKEIPSTRSTSSTAVPHRTMSHSRQHAHSISLGASNTSHRVNRRKSVTSTAVGNAAQAVAAALQAHNGDVSSASTVHRKGLGPRKGSESLSVGNHPNIGMFGLKPDLDLDSTATNERRISTALADENQAGGDISVSRVVSTENRNRRASEGSYLARGEDKRSASELRCDTCGKSYKHSSCLTKHRWEHDPAWAVTSKLLISKHQQVQLLEAASVLVNMNGDGMSQASGNNHQESEVSSETADNSGSSEMYDDRALSSTETTPPPTSDVGVSVPANKRTSLSSAGFSRSYRSMPSNSYAESFTSPNLPPQRALYSGNQAPSALGLDDAGLAAAAELLTFGTPRTHPAQPTDDIPPVPPLPEQYQAAKKLSRNTSSAMAYSPLAINPIAQPLSDERANNMPGPDPIPLSTVTQGPIVDDEGPDGEMFRMEA